MKRIDETEAERLFKERPVSLLTIYILIGLGGISLSLLLNANPMLETFLLLIAGFLIGAFGERLIRNRNR